MAIDVLQAFLTKRMFDVGGDDQRVTPLREAAGDIATLLRAAPQRAATFTMVAIDSAIDKDEPVVGEVMKVLEVRWQSYAGAFTDAQLPTVARAIILHALSAAMGSEPIAAAVSLTARSLLPRLGVVGDRALWTEIIGDADSGLAQRAERDWALPSATSAADTTLSVAAVEPLAPPSIKTDWLIGRLEAASGPHNAEGEAIKGANPLLPNNGQAWATTFASQAGSAITSLVNTAAEMLAKNINQREGADALRTAIAEYVSTTSSALIRTALGLERRTALLWWKEALFSPMAQASYRALDPAVAAALAAIDASHQTGAFAPRMAEAVVRETLRSIDPIAMTVERPLTEHGQALATAADPVRAVLDGGYQVIHSEPGRTPLGALVPSGSGITAEALITRLGLARDDKVSAMEFGVWLFRDLQAAAATPPPTKRKRGGKTA